MEHAGLAGGVAVQTFVPQATQGHVLCCMCGVSIVPNASNMCVNCIRSQVDITEGIQKQVTVLWCKECGRYLQPPKHWVTAELESKELLTFCIKKIKGLNKVKLVDAGFIWTEPHSMRLKVKLTIQAEVLNGAILQQSFVVDFTIERNMCPDCNRANANPNSWTACVQVRQHVHHKRTFFFLEQLILKHGADANVVKVKDIHEGIDFFYQNRSHALKLIDFLQGVVPIRFRNDKQLVSADLKSNTYNYKYTFSVEIAPLCKDDLVCLPAKVASGLGHLGPLVLVTKISNQITLMDPQTLRSTSMDASVYWRQPFTALCSMKSLVEYVVLDIEPLGPSSNKWALAEVQLARASDFGRNDQVYFAKTHLGNILHPGDMALGYDLVNAQLVGLDFEAHVSKGGNIPDVVLVRKSYEDKRRKRRAKGQAARPWRLKHLAMEVDDGSEAGGAGGARGARGAAAAEAQQAERERFLEELEEDPELRQQVNIYKDSQVLAALQQRQATAGGPAAAAARPAGLDDGMSDDEDDDELPQIPLEELLDDLEGLAIADQHGVGAAGAAFAHKDMDHEMEDV